MGRMLRSCTHTFRLAYGTGDGAAGKRALRLRQRQRPQLPSTSSPTEWRNLVTMPRRRKLRAISRPVPSDLNPTAVSVLPLTH
jgi:hypothetical protein